MTLTLNSCAPPLPPTPWDSDCPSSTVSSSTLSEMASVRAELLAYFTHVLLGDALAAEYLILHLISDVYATWKFLKALRFLCAHKTLLNSGIWLLFLPPPPPPSSSQLQPTRCPPAGEVHAERQRLPSRRTLHPETLPDAPAAGAFRTCGCRRCLGEPTAGVTSLFEPESCLRIVWRAASLLHSSNNKLPHWYVIINICVSIKTKVVKLNITIKKTGNGNCLNVLMRRLFRRICPDAHRKSVMETLCLHLSAAWPDTWGHRGSR